MLTFLVYILISGLIVGLLLWGVAEMPGDPAPKRIVRMVIIGLFVIWLIWLLLGFLPGPGPFGPSRSGWPGWR